MLVISVLGRLRVSLGYRVRSCQTTKNQNKLTKNLRWSWIQDQPALHETLSQNKKKIIDKMQTWNHKLSYPRCVTKVILYSMLKEVKTETKSQETDKHLSCWADVCTQVLGCGFSDTITSPPKPRPTFQVRSHQCLWQGIQAAFIAPVMRVTHEVLFLT